MQRDIVVFAMYIAVLSFSIMRCQVLWNLEGWFGKAKCQVLRNLKDGFFWDLDRSYHLQGSHAPWKSLNLKIKMSVKSTLGPRKTLKFAVWLFSLSGRTRKDCSRQIWQLSLRPDHLVSHSNDIFYYMECLKNWNCALECPWIKKPWIFSPEKSTNPAPSKDLNQPIGKAWGSCCGGCTNSEAVWWTSCTVQTTNTCKLLVS